MKKNSIVSAIATYFIIIFLVIGINLFLAMPLISVAHEASGLEKIESSSMQQYFEIYENYCRTFSNMIVALLAIISLTLVVVGLSLRVNKARNKGIYNAITLSGITVILYLIWFVINIASSYGGLF